MPFYNLAQQHLSNDEMTIIDQSLDALEQVLEGRKRNLSPEERQRYGSVNEANKLFVNKVYDFSKTQPGMCSPDVDWEEFEADYQDRTLIQTRLNRLKSLMEILENNKILHDFDNFQNALMDYSFTQYKKDSVAGGYVSKFNELRQFFSKSVVDKTATPPAEKDA